MLYTRTILMPGQRLTHIPALCLPTGLCGTVDGQSSTDMLGSDMVTYNPGSAETFVGTWRVTGSESILYGVVASGSELVGDGTVWCDCMVGTAAQCSVGNDVEDCVLYTALGELQGGIYSPLQGCVFTMIF